MFEWRILFVSQNNFLYFNIVNLLCTYARTFSFKFATFYKFFEIKKLKDRKKEQKKSKIDLKTINFYK